MALNISVRNGVIAALGLHEGRENSFYQDSVGKVTIGVGYMVPDRNAVAALMMFPTLSGGTLSIVPASLGTKQAEFDTIAALPTGYTASWYKSRTSLVMKDADIDSLLALKVNEFYLKLTALYTKGNRYPVEFDAMPEGVQSALFDMIYNLGASGFKNKFPKFNQAIKASDWATAAAQSNRPQVSSARNQYVKNLFNAAALAAKPTK